MVNLLNIMPVAMSDHYSILRWDMIIPCTLTRNEIISDVENCTSLHKYDTRNIPDTVLQDTSIIQELHSLVLYKSYTFFLKLESSMHSQTDIDNAHAELCNILDIEMSLNFKRKSTVKSSNSKFPKKYRKAGKPWWNDDLLVKRRQRCKCQNKCLECKIPATRKRFRIEFMSCRKDPATRKRFSIEVMSCRKDFNRLVQKSKRQYWFNVQQDLLQNVSKDPNKFWKSFGKISVGYDRKYNIPLEIISVSGCIAKIVLLFKNDSSVSYLHVLIKVCFNSGKIPLE